MRRLPLIAGLLLAAAQSFAQPIRLAVDATDVPRGLLHSSLSIPVQAGPVTLLYPKWIPGEHGPTGPVSDVVNLQISANGQRIGWHRDPVDMYRIGLEVPSGVTSLDIKFDFLLPAGGEFSAGRTATPRLVLLSWNTLVLYPQGKPADAIDVNASLKLPAGWQFATALPVERASGNSIEFKTAPLATLVDSPVQAGLHTKKVKLHDADGRAHELDLVADSAAALELPDGFGDTYNALVEQAALALGGRHYRGYHWLVTLSDGVAHFGLEHHESSDDRLDENTLQTPEGKHGLAELLSHEYVHSWNGKYRRPAGLLSPDYDAPMHGDLLWVYEGLTQYLGNILPSRIGAWSPEFSRDSLAATAADLDTESGRTWRPLADTAVEAQLLYNVPDEWWSVRRGTDFYEESVYIWLEADAIIRRESGGKRSLDDFTRKFYGGLTGPMVKPYTFDDVVAALSDAQPHDWRAFLTSRLESVDAHAPLGGLVMTGWKLTYSDKPNEYLKDRETHKKALNLRSSIGLYVKESGSIVDVLPGKAGAAAGLAPGFEIVAVNGRKFTMESLRTAVKESKDSTEPIEIIGKSGDFYSVHRLDYHGGAAYAHLERVEGKPDLLAAIFAARK